MPSDKPRASIFYDIIIKKSSIKTISAYELAHDACGGNFVLDVGFLNVVEESDHGTNLLIALVTRLNLLEKGIDILLNYGKFIEGRAIENNVGIFLIWENPSFLAASNRIPHIEGSLNGRATVFEVTNRATEKSES